MPISFIGKQPAVPHRTPFPVIVRSSNQQTPTLGHRIPSIHGEIQQHLRDLRRIDVHHSLVGFQIHLKINALAHQTPQHAFRLRNHGIQIDYPGLQNLLAAESQQLPCKRCGA